MSIEGFSKNRRTSLFAVVLAICALPQATYAQSATRLHTGTITSVFASSGYNEAFRVSLTQNGSNPMSECPGGFAYVNIDWNNYQTYVAELTTLYVKGVPITVTMQTDSNGFCQLIEFGT